MEIYLASKNDLPSVMNVYSQAKKFMAATGNPTQWSGSYPDEETLLEDIEKNQLYVVKESNMICGVFALIGGTDPTYLVIDDGKWLNDEPYGTVHRIASDGTVHGILPFCMSYAFGKYENVRIDTHEDNKVMQHLLNKNGFTRCGIIYLENGDPRIAYQKKMKREK